MLLLLGEEFVYPKTGGLIFTVGVVVGLMALYKNQIGNFNIRPDIKYGCHLITDGIYRYVRHPMYSSVLLIMLGIVFLYMNIYEVVLYLILVVDLLVKMLYEESLWVCKSKEYVEYMQKTKRLIPYIF